MAHAIYWEPDSELRNPLLSSTQKQCEIGLIFVFRFSFFAFDFSLFVFRLCCCHHVPVVSGNVKTDRLISLLCFALLLVGRPTDLDIGSARAYCACSRCGWGWLGYFSFPST